VTAPQSWRRASSLTLSEVAEIVGISRSKVYEMVGDIPTFKDPSHRLRVRPADLERWMRDRLPKAADQAQLFSGTGEVEDAVHAVACWLAERADPDGVIRDPEAVAILNDALGGV